MVIYAIFLSSITNDFRNIPVRFLSSRIEYGGYVFYFGLGCRGVSFESKRLKVDGLKKENWKVMWGNKG